MKQILFFFILVFGLSSAFAADYICPNERNPGMAIPIFAKSNHGVYVSVGSERSFVGAALTKAEALYVVDIDPDIITFTQINKALLMASRNRAHYVQLRLTANQKAWKNAADKLSDENKKLLEDPESWNFWKLYIRNLESQGQEDCRLFHAEVGSENEPFYQANYLFDEVLFTHLKMLAVENRIETFVMDLTDTAAVQKVTQDIKSKGFALGVVDTSNVITYVDVEAAQKYMMNFDQVARPDTIYLFTRISKRTDLGQWHYWGFTSLYVREKGPKFIYSAMETNSLSLAFQFTPRIILDGVDYRPWQAMTGFENRQQGLLDQ